MTKAQFIDEFTTLLDGTHSITEPVFIMGDLNFHFDVEDDTYTKQLKALLQSYDMTQLVTSATHEHGHTLDVIISRASDNIEVSNPSADYFISDHCFVTCTLNKPRPPLSVKSIKFRKWRSLNKAEFTASITAIANNLPESHDVDLLVNYFNDALLGTLDHHIPLKQKDIICRPEVPWYSIYLREFKRIRRTIEHIHLKFKTALSTQIYKKTKNRYTVAVSSAKSEYYRGRVEAAEGNTKKLYSVVSDLLDRVQDNPLPPCSSDILLANQFLDYFSEKFEKIRLELDNEQYSPSPLVDCANSTRVGSYLDEFTSLTEDEVGKIISNSKLTNCELDVIPASKLKEYLLCEADITRH